MLTSLLNQPSKIIVGLMSGTSLDGIDAAVVRIDGYGMDSKVELLHFYSRAYDDTLREQLKRICSLDQSSTADVCSMNFLLGEHFAEAVHEAVHEAGMEMSEVDAVSSHGQTVWHIPETDHMCEPPRVRSTLQIGDLSVIAKRTGKLVVGDFRTADMAVGGHGAPLAPYADFILFRDEREGRIAQNIGGIGNCAVLPAAARPEDVVAFDTGPGNMLIDQAVYQLSGGRLSYDEGGRWAAEGTADIRMLEQMLQHPYFRQKPVKTTGREMFGKAYAQQWLNEAAVRQLSAADTVATFTAFTAHSIASGYRDFVLPQTPAATVIVSGGGALNATLLRMMGELLPELTIRIADDFGVSADAKEAIAFAILGNNTLHGVPNNLPVSTGAASPTVMGKLAFP
ncbi:anhydro-N-acetylmuramic acid kinase [Paenibacillus senegalensis]|uniref:anhydro-N-acetylmuramic acid kinase n=1 Tax=Paenibacillus senegalensis TaxID=1465766 RepID=UPI0002899C4B|nr:anhydro-N-acetylmuramic acid kinase [Paenibacillus senegalensis]